MLVVGAVALVTGIVMLTTTEPVAVDGSTGSARAWAVWLLCGGGLWLMAGLALRGAPRRPAAQPPRRTLLWLAAGWVALCLLGSFTAQSPLLAASYGVLAAVFAIQYLVLRRSSRRVSGGEPAQQR